jgi:hypothetical protein
MRGLSSVRCCAWVLLFLSGCSDGAAPGGWCAVDAGFSEMSIYGIAAGSADDVYFQSFYPDLGMGRYDGSAFAMLYSPAVRPRTLWSAGPGDLFAADDRNGGDVARFDGTEWETIRSDVWIFNALSARSVDDVFAVAQFVASPIWGFDGSVWSPMAVDLGPYVFDPGDIWAGPDGTAVAVGVKTPREEYPDTTSTEGVILEYDGAAWSEADLGGLSLVGAYPGSVVGAADGSLWVIGVRQAGADTVGLVYRYDGAGWSEAEPAPAGSQLLEVVALSAAAADDAYAWIDAKDGGGTETSTLVRFDGSTWSEIALDSPAVEPTIIALAQPASGGLVAIVDDAAYVAEPRIMRFDGSSWTTIADETTFPSGFKPWQLLDRGDGAIVVEGATPVSTAEDGWPAQLSLWSYDGTEWALLADGDLLWNGWADSVAIGQDDGSLWAADDVGGIWTLDGATWSESKPANPCTGVSAMWGDGSTGLFVGCDNGAALRWDGATWSIMDTGTELPIVDLWGSGPGDVYAVTYRYEGDYEAGPPYGSSLLHYDGAAWSEVDIGSEGDLTGVWGSRADNVFVAGDGVVMRFDGSAWSSEPFPGDHETNLLHSLWGFESGGRTELYAISDAGPLHYDGSAWKRISVTDDPNATFRAVGGTGPDDVWLAGDDGLLLHYPCE